VAYGATFEQLRRGMFMWRLVALFLSWFSRGHKTFEQQKYHEKETNIVNAYRYLFSTLCPYSLA